MKSHLKFLSSAALAVAALLGNVHGQAVTDPVGYISADVTPSSGANQPLTLVAPTLVQAVEFAGATSSDPSNGTLVEFSGTPLAGLTLNGSYYLEVTSGAQEGYWATIASNTDSSITVADILPSGIGSGAEVKVRKHNTIGNWLGMNNEAGLKGGGDISEGDEVQLFNGASKTLTPYFYSNLEGFSGWFDAAFNDASGTVIEPQQGVIIKRKATTPLTIVTVGHVKTGKTQLEVFSGLNVVSVPFATGTTLGTSELEASLQQGGDISEGDEVQVLNPNQSLSAYFYSNLEGFSGWFDAAFTDASGVTLAEGTGFLIKRKAAGDTVWVAPAQEIAP